MEKRVKVPVEKYKARGNGYLLVYFDDGAYEIIHSNHSLLPKDFDYDKTEIKSKLTMKPGFDAIIIAKSESEDDLKLAARRLSSKLDYERVSLSDSFGFLDRSANLSQSGDATTSEVTVTEDPDVEADAETDADDEEEEEEEDKLDADVKLDVSMDVSIAKQQLVLMRTQVRTQKQILKELKTIKRYLRKGDVETKKPKENITPVFYKGVDVASLGSRNFDPSQFGVTLGRYFFSDDELQKNMLHPKRQSGRPPLSPERSQLFTKAINSRFGADALEEAVRAVNSLGNDLKKGRRKRH